MLWDFGTFDCLSSGKKKPDDETDTETESAKKGDRKHYQALILEKSIQKVVCQLDFGLNVNIGSCPICGGGSKNKGCVQPDQH